MTRMSTLRVVRTLRRSGGVVLLTGLLAACNTAQDARGRTAFVSNAYSALEGAPRRVPLVSLPDAGPAVLVEETRRPGGLHQRIVFGRDGSSRADLTIGIAGSGASGMAKPTKRGIEAELALLPDGPYRVSREPARNAYGPVGVALSGRCAFAWQWIEDLHGIEPGAGLEIPGRISASLRVHHCSRGSVDALTRDLTRLRLGTGSPDRIARAPRRPRPPPAPAKVQPNTVAEPVATFAPAPVARPLVTVNGSRTLVSVPPDRVAPDNLAVSGRSAVPRPGAAGPEALDQPRYLTDAVPSRPSNSVVTAPPQTTTRRDTLSTELPPQAYRGPTPPPFGW